MKYCNFTKSARLYLQTMQYLEFDHPWVYDQYCRSDYHSTTTSDEVTAAGSDCGLRRVDTRKRNGSKYKRSLGWQHA